MTQEPNSQKLKPIIDSIRDRIAEGRTEHVVENPSGWAYGGADFLEVVKSLQEEIQAELKQNSFHVSTASLSICPRILLIPSRCSPALCDTFLKVQIS